MSTAGPVAPGTAVGVVAGLWRYPVKSMAAEPLETASVTWSGLAGDRRWAFVRPDTERNGFPWHTIRETSQMCRYTATLTEPGRPDKSPVQVRTPDGTTFAVDDPVLADDLGAGVRVMRLDRGIFDEMPMSVISAASVTALCALVDRPPDVLRFRPNVLVTSSTGEPYAEEAWIGSVLRIGAAEVRVDQRNTRCVIVDVDPGSGRPDAALLKQIGRHREARAGLYGTVVRPGEVHVGDPVTLA